MTCEHRFFNNAASYAVSPLAFIRAIHLIRNMRANIEAD
jgi:hypothetical protein